MSEGLAIGAVAILAAVAETRKRTKGSPSVEAWEELTNLAQSSHQGLQQHFPQTARGQLEVYLGEETFWAGRGNRQIGFSGPTDGRMVPVEARYVMPMSENIFYGEKLASLVEAIREGWRPVVRPGYGHFSLVDQTDIEESHDYAEWELGEPYEEEDKGALRVTVRDGNHRTFAALVAGAPFVWVLLSDSDRQDIFMPPPSMKRTYDKLYAAIRKAQRQAGAPLLKRPRRERGSRATRRGYRVMRYDPESQQAISGADSRISVSLEPGTVHRYPGAGMFLTSVDRQYALDYYLIHDQNVLLTYEFDPSQLTTGNITDRQTEFSVPSATLVRAEVLDSEFAAMSERLAIGAVALLALAGALRKRGSRGELVDLGAQRRSRAPDPDFVLLAARSEPTDRRRDGPSAEERHRHPPLTPRQRALPLVRRWPDRVRAPSGESRRAKRRGGLRLHHAPASPQRGSPPSS